MPRRTRPSSRRSALPTFAALLCVLAAAPPTFAQASADGSAAATLEREVRSLMRSGGVPGLSVAVIRDGRPSWSGAFGVKRAGEDEPVTETTVFEAASLSKPVFAAAVLRMAERGEIDLDAPLADLLPYERLEHEPRYRRITPRMVLSHSTGLPNWGGDRLELRFEPGTAFGYSGEGFVYLQKAVESLTGRTLDEVARREVFEPLGMTRSSYVRDDRFDGSVTAAHDALGRPHDMPRRTEGNAAASLLTTADDYARFVAGVLRGELLRPETRAAMLTPVARGRWGDDDVPSERIWWGLGWGLWRDGDRVSFWHWGDNGTRRAFVAADPATGDGIVYFANSSEGLSIGEDLVSLVLPGRHPAFDWLGTEAHDDPTRIARRTVYAAYLEDGDAAGLRRYREAVRADSAVADERFATRLAEFLVEEDRAPAAVELLRLATARDPGSAELHVALGDALLHAGRFADAAESYERARPLDAEDVDVEGRMAWARDLLTAERRPVAVPDATLRRYAGTYGPRQVRFEDGRLVYQREGNPPYPLTALSADTFALDGLPTFRIRFVEQDGRIVAIEGLYVEGRSDRSERTD